MSGIEEARVILARLLPDCEVSILWDGDEPIIDIDALFAEEAHALAKRIANGDKAHKRLSTLIENIEGFIDAERITVTNGYEDEVACVPEAGLQALLDAAVPDEREAL